MNSIKIHMYHPLTTGFTDHYPFFLSVGLLWRLNITSYYGICNFVQNDIEVVILLYCFQKYISTVHWGLLIQGEKCRVGNRIAFQEDDAGRDWLHLMFFTFILDSGGVCGSIFPLLGQQGLLDRLSTLVSHPLPFLQKQKNKTREREKTCFIIHSPRFFRGLDSWVLLVLLMGSKMLWTSWKVKMHFQNVIPFKVICLLLSYDPYERSGCKFILDRWNWNEVDGRYNNQYSFWILL